jgi:uncharacterized protein YhaN
VTDAERLAEATALLERIVKYAREDRAVTPGVTRLARVVNEAREFLSSSPAQPAMCRADTGGVPCVERIAELEAALEKTTAEWDRFRERIIAEANQELEALTICRTSLEASRAETAAAQARIAELTEQSESWRRAHLAWQHWAATWLRELGLQPEDGELGDDPVRVELQSAMAAQSALRARIAELELRLSGEVANHDCTVMDAQAAINKAETALRELEKRIHTMKPDLGFDDEQQ